MVSVLKLLAILNIKGVHITADAMTVSRQSI